VGRPVHYWIFLAVERRCLVQSKKIYPVFQSLVNFDEIQCTSSGVVGQTPKLDVACSHEISVKLKNRISVVVRLGRGRAVGNRVLKSSILKFSPWSVFRVAHRNDVILGPAILVKSIACIA